MKDPYAVLLQKERDLLRVRQEVEALRQIAPLLSDETTTPAVEITSTSAAEKNKWPLEVKAAWP